MTIWGSDETVIRMQVLGEVERRATRSWERRWTASSNSKQQAGRTNSREQCIRASNFALHGATISKVRVSGGTEAILIPQPPHTSGGNMRVSCNYPHLSFMVFLVNPLNAELHPICHLLALLQAHHILQVSRIRVTISTWNRNRFTKWYYDKSLLRLHITFCT